MDFSSDTSAPAHPAVLEAIARANAGHAPSYGADDVTRRVERGLAEVFEADVKVWLCASGTAANALSLSVLCGPAGAILCHAEAHIERDERGAPELFTGGAKLRLLGGAGGKVDLDALRAAVASIDRSFVHESPAEVLSLTNLTESGTAYTAEELGARFEAARSKGLACHVDGARFANAVASTGVAPADLSWRAGADVVTFGASKNGAIGCEAIVLLGPRARERHEALLVMAKRTGHMPAKMRYLAAQMEAMLDGGRWLDLARHANAMASRLARGLETVPGAALAQPVQGNEVFVRLPPGAEERLRAAGARFYGWLDGSSRLVCSWATREEDVGAILAALA